MSRCTFFVCALVGAGCGSESGIGGDLHPVEETIDVGAPIVDVLWVVDNSPSMSNDWRSMAGSFRTFVEAFEHVETDVHIGVVSTDMSSEAHQGRLRELNGHRWVEFGMPRMTSTLQHMVTFRGSDIGSDVEMGRLAAWTAIERAHPGGHNDGFLRFDPESYLHVIVVSDEDDFSRLPEEDFVEDMRALKRHPEQVTFSAVVSGQTPRSYTAMVEALGGTLERLGDDWQRLHTLLGETLAPPPRSEFALRDTPLPWSLEVDVRRSGEDWVAAPLGEAVLYDEGRNAIRFVDAIPDIGTEVRLRYLTSALPSLPPPS